MKKVVLLLLPSHLDSGSASKAVKFNIWEVQLTVQYNHVACCAHRAEHGGAIGAVEP